ncbi:hypothetical protein KL930_000472 [Ogataea haglerorum]|nr:hypothetical protein KL932_002695 [Ogataea haglerorum]KAG7777573.1 hypothetical protein KL922_002963 [Ogataea haglerorum]KAG7783138.1 hypothetical protein KL930_000472 [Ogataea haglerorum]KAG7807252.1 hypothetical protein KL924_003969 [Ogataea haglerorum]
MSSPPRQTHLRSPVILLKSPVLPGGVIRSPRPKDSHVDLPSEQVIEDVVDIIKTEERRNWLRGLLYLFLTVATWVFGLQLTNNVLKGDSYQHPLFVAYVNGGLFVIFGIKPAFKSLIKACTASEPRLDDSVFNSYDSCGSSSIILHAPSKQLSLKELIIVAVQAGLIYYANAALSAIALQYTSASNQTILTTTSSVFTLLLSYLCGVDTLSLGKVVSVLASIAGICLITFNSLASFQSASPNPILGNCIALCGTFLYSCYLVLLRVKIGKETSPDNERLIFGLLGLSILILACPLLLFASFLGFEKLSLPDSSTIFWIVFIGGLFNCLSDYFSILATLLTSPLITSLSLSTAIPVNMICDSVFYKVKSTSARYYLGIILIFSSFVFANLSNEDEVVQEAIEEAIEEAIQNDEMLSPFLSPYLQQQGRVDDVPRMNINTSQRTGPPAQVVVAGGHNHRYFIREIPPI